MKSIQTTKNIYMLSNIIGQIEAIKKLPYFHSTSTTTPYIYAFIFTDIRTRL